MVNPGRAQMQTLNNVPPAYTVLPADQARHGVTGHKAERFLAGRRGHWQCG
jgi:hypothetical protein